MKEIQRDLRSSNIHIPAWPTYLRSAVSIIRDPYANKSVGTMGRLYIMRLPQASKQVETTFPVHKTEMM